jgi:ribosomal protein L2
MAGPEPGSPSKSAGGPPEDPPRTDFAGKLVLGLGNPTGIQAGTQVRLASARFEGVFPVPRSAVVHQDGTERVWVIGGTGGRRAELRAVELASDDPETALVARGLRSGDTVILDPPASLKPGSEVATLP